MEPKFTGAPPVTAEFDEILAEPENWSHHRRAFSENYFPVADTFDDLLNFDFDSDPFDFDMPNFPPPPPPPPTAALVQVDSISSEESNARASRPGPVGSTVGLDRGKCVVVDNLCGIGMAGGGAYGGAKGGGEDNVERRHRHSISVDESTTTTTSFGGEPASLVKRAMTTEQLAELARVDPKRVKRILANRQSAAKSKERKTRYARELQKRVQLLKIKATNLSTDVGMLQRETVEMAVRNKELRIRVEAERQQSKIRHALSAALKEEVRSLRNETDHLATILSTPSLCWYALSVLFPVSSAAVS
ncbi:Transcription factor RF2b [Spatholobus suberectus]|nr:Transcription factor RF2b [Spatholobus suberectus]